MGEDDLRRLYGLEPKEKFTLSFVNPSWGGPFRWVKNAAGRLTLQKLEKGST